MYILLYIICSYCYNKLHTHTHTQIHPSIHPSIDPSIHPSIYLSTIYLSISLSLSIYIHTHYMLISCHVPSPFHSNTFFFAFFRDLLHTWPLSSLCSPCEMPLQLCKLLWSAWERLTTSENSQQGGRTEH